jgi:hypothetical protein
MRSVAALYAAVFVVPHAELYEDVRRHMERVRCGRRDLRVRACGRKAKRRMIRIVERVDDEVRRARMVRVLLEHLLYDGRRERLTAKTLVAGPHRAEQRQRIQRGDLVVVRRLFIHARHRVRVRLIARELVARRVEQLIDGFDVRLLLRQLCLREPAIECRRELAERLFRRVDIYLRPERMVVAHRLAPIGERESRIRLLGFPERFGRLVELEAVKVLHAFDERGLRRRGARGLKLNRAELRRLRTGGRRRDQARQNRHNQRKPRHLHKGLRVRVSVGHSTDKSRRARSDFA